MTSLRVALGFLLVVSYLGCAHGEPPTKTVDSVDRSPPALQAEDEEESAGTADGALGVRGVEGQEGRIGVGVGTTFGSGNSTEALCEELLAPFQSEYLDREAQEDDCLRVLSGGWQAETCHAEDAYDDYRSCFKSCMRSLDRQLDDPVSECS